MENENVPKTEITESRVKELEYRNREELDSLEKLIILFEDIKNIENSNLTYANDIIKEVKFDEGLLIGKLGNICKSYFQSFYDIKKKLTENLKKIISVLKLKKTNESENEANDIEQKNILNQKYIGKKDIENIIQSIPLLSEYNKEFDISFTEKVSNNLSSLNDEETINNLNILKIIKEEKCTFEDKVEDICKNGTSSKELNLVVDLLNNDSSQKQEKCLWLINYLNKYRAKLSTVDKKVFNAFKTLFEIVFNKFEEKKLYQSMDLAIILIQTFSKVEDNNSILLETEFKNHIIFKNDEIWINLIKQKTIDLVSKIGEENKENYQYIKENIEPLLISYIFTMKDFSVDSATTKKVIEQFCELDMNKQYKFDVETMLAYIED